MFPRGKLSKAYNLFSSIDLFAYNFYNSNRSCSLTCILSFMQYPSKITLLINRNAS